MTSSGNNTASFLILLLPLLLLVVLVLSQRRRARALQDFQASVQVGDEVITTAGLYGRIVGLDDAIVRLEVAPDVILRFDRRAIGTRQAPATG
ncbi:MAG TPA: preprotein translocase subunit YajC [Intrasporangiaceae bacterium]|nr:preprotein translocase subunit YajC [Intrasporangiaceae bacterium]